MKKLQYMGRTVQLALGGLCLMTGCSIEVRERPPEPVIKKEVDVVDARLTDDELLDLVQKQTLRCFWDFAHPVSGLTRESGRDDDRVTLGGSGFGVLSIIVGVERGFISREEAVIHLNRLTTFLKEKADRFHGAWPHWLNGTTGVTLPFSPKDDGGDLVETAFMVQGLLTARQYFDAGLAPEEELRNRITELWESVEWDWYARGEDTLRWHWSPNHGWAMNMGIHGFNEAMIVYILAVASPTHGVPESAYHKGWVQPHYLNDLNIRWDGFRGGPLFLTHYSHLCLTPHFSDDYIRKTEYASYAERHRDVTLINRRHCMAMKNTFTNYSAKAWGLTASLDPTRGYAVHEPTPHGDNGTIAPTAAIGSIVYTPDESMGALRYFYENLGDKLWTEYGFTDAYNDQLNWVSDTWLSIDQGPIIVMIENYRSGLLWDLFMEIPEIQSATRRLGFEFSEKQRW